MALRFVIKLFMLLLVLVGMLPKAKAETFVIRDDRGVPLEIDVRLGGISIDIPAEQVTDLAGYPRLEISQRLIREIARSGKYKDIEVRRLPVVEGRPERWLVSVKPQRRIYEVSVSGVGLGDESIYTSRLRSKPGSIFLEGALDDDVQILTNQLRTRGYPLGQVDGVQVTGVPNGSVNIEFRVNKGRVCRFSEIRTTAGQGFFDAVNLPIDLGSVCNIPRVEKQLKEQQEQLRQQGYLSAIVELDEVIYSEDRGSASIIVRAERGPRTIIEAVDLATGSVKDDFLGSEGVLTTFDIVALSEEDLQQKIRDFYLEDGYAQARVEGPNLIDLDNGNKVLRFYVQKGPRIIIGRVEFIGDTLPVSRNDALDAMDLDPGILSQSVPFNDSLLTDYRDRLQALLLNRGYSEATVMLPKVNISRTGGTASLEFTIRLGPLFVFSELAMLGRPEGFEFDQSELDDILEIGDPLSADAVVSLRDSVRKQLIEAGYYYARVEDSLNAKRERDNARDVLLTLDMRPGPIVRVRNVYTDGETYGKAERIKLVSQLTRGSIFSPGNLELARRRVLRTDLFGSVSVEAFDFSALERREPEVDVVIRTIGRSGYTLSISPGYGSENGYRFGIDYVRNELNESGLRFNANTSFSQDRQQLPIGRSSQQVGRKITLGLTEPLLRFGQWASPFDVRVLFGSELSNLGFESRLFETTDLTFLWRPVFFGLDFLFETGYSREWSRSVSATFEPLAAINNPSLTINEVMLRASFDSRDSVEWARKGMFHEVSSQHSRFGLNSDVAYDRYTIASNFYIPLFARWNHVLAGGFITISDVTNDREETVTAPESRRSALTGRALVRGFPEFGRSLGPLIWLNLEPVPGEDKSNCPNAVRSIGATNLLYAKYELRYRTQALSNMLGIAWFVDSGSAFFTNEELETISKRIDEGAANNSSSSGGCVLEAARIYQGGDVGRDAWRDALSSYFETAYVSSGFGLRIIIPNFAAISVDWGLPLRDPATLASGECSFIGDAENSDEPPACLKRDRQDRIFGAIPFPGAIFFGIGATL